MQKFETTDPKLARLCRFAQFRGEKTTIIIEGRRVTGMVRAVFEDKSTTPTRWFVTVKLSAAA